MTGLVAAAALLLAGAPARAPSTLEQCDALVREAPEDLGSYRCYWFVGRSQAQLHAAARRLEAVLEGDPGNARARLILGVVAADLGRPDAEALIRAAAEEASAPADAEVEILGRLTLARLMRFARRTDDAGAELDRALARAVAHGDPELEARVRVDLGWQSYYRRDYGEAWTLFRKAEALVFPAGHVQERADVLDGLAATSWALDRGPQALEFYARQRELAVNDPIRMSDVCRNMALVAADLRDQGRIEPDAAEALAREALEAARRAGNRAAETGARLMLARARTGREAEREIRAALDLALALDRPADVSSGFALLGRTLWASDPRRPERAFAALDRAVTVAREHGDFESLAEALLARADVRRQAGPEDRALADVLAALDAVERIRDLQSGGELKARVFARFAPEYRSAAQHLLQTGDVEGAFAVSERMRARQLLDTLDAAGARGQPPPVPAVLPEVRRTLGEDQALIAYVLGPQAGWAVAAARDGARAVRLPACGALPPRVSLYLGLLARSDGSEREGAEALHRCLLAPVLESLPRTVSRLVIVPDGPLHRLAFRELAPAGGLPLGERYEVSLVPSAATWLRWRARPGPDGGAGVLALADPDGGLAGAREEVSTLRRRLGRGGTVLVGRRARAAAIGGERLRRAAVLHLAAHAVVNDERPEDSAVQLAAGPLRYADILGLPLEGRLVVLSACRGADGPVIGGEGAMGLAGAFFQAGARCVVAGLWPVRDRETAALVADLSRLLGQGQSVAAALAEASREARRRGAPPSCWAGLVVLGDGDLVVAPSGAEGRPSPARVAVLAALLVAAVTAFALYRRWWRA